MESNPTTPKNMDQQKFASLKDLPPKEETSSEPKEPPRVVPLHELQRPPEDDDPNELIQRRFLSRGGGMMLVGATGHGKSTLIMQMLISWAVGMECFGLAPNGPLRVLLIQGENDDGDLAEMRDGIMKGLGFDTELRRACGENFSVITETSSLAFVATLKNAIEQLEPDLVCIDPVLSFITGDSNSQEAVSGFLRRDLTPLLKKSECGALLVHHMSKAGMNALSNGMDLSYAGGGATEWANWPRGILVLLRDQDNKSVFRLSAAKRSARLDWFDMSGERTNERLIQHCREDGQIFWEEYAPDATNGPVVSRGASLEVLDNKILALVPDNEPILKKTLHEEIKIAKLCSHRRADERMCELVRLRRLEFLEIQRPRARPAVGVRKLPAVRTG